MPVPYTFANQSGPIPLSELDANFATIPNYANAAGIVYNSVQGNITSLGTLTSLSVSGITSLSFVSASGNITSGNISTNNVTSLGFVSATGNITGSYILGNGSQLTGLPAQYSNANVAAYLPVYNGNILVNNISSTSTYLALGPNSYANDDSIAIGSFA